jgi:hypothetical protein
MAASMPISAAAVVRMHAPLEAIPNALNPVPKRARKP